LFDYLARCEFVAENNQVFAMNEMVRMERQHLQVA
jgi:hypothetical protein